MGQVLFSLLIGILVDPHLHVANRPPMMWTKRFGFMLFMWITVKLLKKVVVIEEVIGVPAHLPVPQLAGARSPCSVKTELNNSVE